MANRGVEFVATRFQTCRTLDDRECLRWQRDLKAVVSYRLVFRFHERLKELTLPILAGIGMKSSPHKGVRDGLHQFADLGFQIFIRDNQRADGRPHVAPAPATA